MLIGYSEVPRGEGYEEVMDSLVTRITGIEHFKHHTGCHFTNDVFEIRPYYFGKCLCDYGKKYDEFLKTRPHKQDCFQVELGILNDAFKNHPQYNQINKLKAERANEERKLCHAHKIDYKDGKKLDNICNCGAFNEFSGANANLQHDALCPTMIPNFTFKPEALRIYWYKTYFRDSCSSKPLILEEFKRIISSCLESF